MFKPIERATGDEDEIEAGREAGLVGAKGLAQATFGVGAGDGVAHGGAGGDEAGAGRRGRGASFAKATEGKAGSGERGAVGSG